MAIGDLARRRVWLLVTLSIVGVYLAFYLRRGWYPHDEGLLGQTAERVLQGQMPHRDFDDPYTGLLTYLHAAAFQLGGIRLVSLRIPLLVASLLGFAAFFQIATRFVDGLSAAGLTLLAMVWSVPNYPASIPSWYNLFFALGMGLALLRWSEDPRRRWLVIAGLFGGLSFLIKLSGLFAVGGGFLFLVYATQRVSGLGGVSRRWPAWIVTGGLLLIVAGLWRSLGPGYHPRFVVHLALPGSLFILGLAVREWRTGASGMERVITLARAGFPFLLGVLAPVALFGIWFATHGALDALVTDVFLIPFRRLAYASVLPPAPFWLLAGVPLLLLLRPRREPDSRVWTRWGAVILLVLALVLGIAMAESFVYRTVWQSARSVIPILGAIAGALLVFPRRWMTDSAELRFMLLAILSVFGGLIQFPFAAPVYFLYVAPLAVLAVAALVAGLGRTPVPFRRAVVLFYVGFGVVLMNPGALAGLGFRFEGFLAGRDLALPRGGLRVPEQDSATYQQIMKSLGQAGDSLIWAGPDAPEIYFLGGYRNPSRVLFDFLGNSPPDSLPGFLEIKSIPTIVVNHQPPFSPRVSDSLLKELRRIYPRREVIGRFEVMRR